MSEPGIIPATREQNWVLWVNPSKGVAKEADQLIQKRYKVGSDPKDSFSPDGYSPTISDFSLGTGAITAVAFGKDFYNGYKGISLPANTTVSTSRAMIVRPKISPGVSAGLGNIVKSNNPITNPKARNLGRRLLAVNAGLFVWSLYKDLTRAEDIDRKFVVDFDDKTQKLNSTLVANNSGLISGDYKALNLSFRVKNGKIEMGQSNSSSEASTEQEAKHLAITDSEKNYNSEGAVETLNDILTLVRKDNDTKAFENLQSFLELVDENQYSDSDKQKIIEMKQRLELIEVAQQTPVASTASSSGTSPTTPAPVTSVDLSFIDRITNNNVKDALRLAEQNNAFKDFDTKYPEPYQKINVLKQLALVFDPNLTANDLDTIQRDLTGN